MRNCSAINSRVFAYYPTADTQAAQNALYVLEEGGRTLQIDKRWTVKLNSPHHPRMGHHVHILYRGNDVFIINKDGTPSHHTTRDAVPDWLIQKLKSKGLIEKSYLLEHALYADRSSFTVPQKIISHASIRAEVFDVLDDIRHSINLQRYKGLISSLRPRR